MGAFRVVEEFEGTSASAVDAAAEVEAGMVAEFAARARDRPTSGPVDGPASSAARERLVARLDMLRAVATRYAAARHAAGVSRARILAQARTLVRTAMRAEGCDDPHVAATLEAHVTGWCRAAVAARRPHPGDFRPPWGGTLT